MVHTAFMGGALNLDGLGLDGLSLDALHMDSVRGVVLDLLPVVVVLLLLLVRWLGGAALGGRGPQRPARTHDRPAPAGSRVPSPRGRNRDRESSQG